MKIRAADIAQNLVVWLGGVLVLIPFLWMIASSFKTQGEVFGSPLSFFPQHAMGSNYSHLFRDWPFLRWYWNSILITLTITLLTLFFSGLAGFGFAKYRFKGRSWLFMFIFASMSIPFQSILIPLYSEMAKMHWINSYWSLIVPFVAPPLGIFLMRQYMESVPDVFMDAARIDGCTEFGIYVKIMLPLLRPAMGALSIITFVFTWSNFLWPLVMLNDDHKFTLPLGLYSLMSNAASGGQVQYGELFAGTTLASAPPVLLFLLMQRSFVRGLTMGGVKN